MAKNAAGSWIGHQSQPVFATYPTAGMLAPRTPPAQPPPILPQQPPPQQPLPPIGTVPPPSLPLNPQAGAPSVAAPGGRNGLAEALLRINDLQSLAP